MEKEPEALPLAQSQVGDAADPLKRNFVHPDLGSGEAFVRKSFREIVQQISCETLPLTFDNDAVLRTVTHFLRRNNAVAKHGHAACVVDIDARTGDVAELDAT